MNQFKNHRPYDGRCEFPSGWHWLETQWHHPISWNEFVGVRLCQGHHSLEQGRKVKYHGECSTNESLEQIRAKVHGLVVAQAEAEGFSEADFDKN